MGAQLLHVAKPYSILDGIPGNNTQTFCETVYCYTKNAPKWGAAASTFACRQIHRERPPFLTSDLSPQFFYLVMQAAHRHCCQKLSLFKMKMHLLVFIHWLTKRSRVQIGLLNRSIKSPFLRVSSVTCRAERTLNTLTLLLRRLLTDNSLA